MVPENAEEALSATDEKVQPKLISLLGTNSLNHPPSVFYPLYEGGNMKKNGTQNWQAFQVEITLGS